MTANTPEVPMLTLEQRLDEWLKQPGTVVTQAERLFIEDMRGAAANGVGYGWMQQVIEWEWKSKGPGAWGPEYFQAKITEAERALSAAQKELELLPEKLWNGFLAQCKEHYKAEPRNLLGSTAQHKTLFMSAALAALKESSSGAEKGEG